MIRLLKHLFLPDRGSLFSILLKRTMPVSLLALGLAGYIILERADNTRLKKVDAELEELDVFGSALLETRLNSIIDQARNLSESSLIINGLIDHEGRDFYMPPFFRSLKIASPADVEVSLTDYKGRILYQNSGQAEPMLPTNEWLETVVDEGTPYFATDPSQLFMAFPVHYAGLPEGALIARIGHSQMENLFRLNLAGADSYVSIPGSFLMAGSGRYQRWNSDTPPSLDSSAFFSRRTALSEHFDLALTITLPREAGIAELKWVYDFLIAALVIAVITSIASIILSATLAGKQLAPLIRSIESIQSMQDTRIRMPATGADEIRQVGKRLNRMLDKLHRTSTSRDYLDSIFSGILDGIITIDLDGTIETVNQASLQLFGYEEAELIGKDVSILLPKDERSAHKKYVRQSELYGTRIISRSRNLKGLRKDQTTFDLELMVTPLGQEKPRGFVGVCRDITDRLKAAQRLADSEVRYRSILESASDGYLYLDPALGIIVDTNDALLHMCGYQKDDVVGRSPSFLFTRDSHSTLANHGGENINGQPKPIEISLKCKDGSIRHVRYNLNSAQDNHGKILAQFAILTDLTHEVQLRQTLELARQEAENIARMKSDFLANMSHEIRTPMNGVIGMLELLADTRLTKTQKNYIETALKSADMQLSVINDILDYSKIEAGKLSLEETEFNLRELFKDVITLHRASAETKELVLTCQLPEDLPERYMGDPTRLRQVVVNLVGNAIKFTDQGSVTITCREKQHRPDRSTLEIRVIDTGIGIEAEKIDQLFQPFSQADSSTTRKFGGTGLGLMISKSILDAMQGTIGVESTLGQGTEFWLELQLPLATGEQTPPPVSVSAVMDQSAGPLRLDDCRILLVEDTLINQKVAHGILKTYGCSIDLAEDGLQAVDQYKNQDYDLVLMDVQMPKLDGFGATKRIRQFEKEVGKARVPIVALTAHALKSDRELSLQNDMDDHLAKPFRKEDLELILRQWLKNGVSTDTSPIEATDEEGQPDAISLDLSVLQQLQVNLDHNTAMLGEIILEFEKMLPDLCTNMYDAIKSDDKAGRIRSAHSLKACAASLGAMGISETARRIEQADEIASQQDLIAQVQEIETEFQAIKPRLNEFLEQQSS
ncbi:PAS domain S-box protein [Aestuariispira insulae]|uniref:Sensory/regulatory protein RpfC n=1 Tax=Aestuariispira insulae TaxID=1461337 RepID=A0A3D9HX52_9PROT|nr:PAS domain S-box protein [Aestuariispira insulae]RED54083.1 PAS domain S-box-containing protein [Aestuariispira insulae]